MEVVGIRERKGGKLTAELWAATSPGVKWVCFRSQAAVSATMIHQPRRTVGLRIWYDLLKKSSGGRHHLLISSSIWSNHHHQPSSSRNHEFVTGAAGSSEGERGYKR